jgi:hypothetical protein
MFVRRFLLLAALSVLMTGVCRADVVLDWNTTLLDAIRADGTAPPKAARAMALVHISMFDAVNGILPDYSSYLVTNAAPNGASPEAAAVQAAYTVLSFLYPAQLARFDAARTASLAGIADGTAETSGIRWGEQVAQAILAARANDHATDTATFSAPSGANWWIPTPPAYATSLLPNWPTVTPWCMSRGDQFRSAAPPSPNSAAYAEAFREVKELGRVDSASRSAEQTQIALFWADGPGTATPPGHWLAIAQSLSRQRSLSLSQNARLFALLSLTLADAAIVAWDTKYAYSNWRPITGIQHADTDGNPATDADAAWTPLLATPPFPSYTSGHSTFSSSGARLLAHFFGSDSLAFSTTSDGLPGVTRSFNRLSDAAEEAGQSRIYGGIHWQFDNRTGLSNGRALADDVFFRFLGPRAAPKTCTPSATALCLHDGRFRVEATWKTDSAGNGARAEAHGNDSGRFWFFSADNTEVVVKVLDGCGLNNRYWVLASGLTNVETLVTITDTKSGTSRRYFNPSGTAMAPVQDVGAFATCP